MVCRYNSYVPITTMVMEKFAYLDRALTMIQCASIAAIVVGVEVFAGPYSSLVVYILYSSSRVFCRQGIQK
jgi:hypothetical protein